MKFLREYYDRVETLTEETSKGRVLYIEGPFLQAVDVNRNGRSYSRDAMEQAVDIYQKNYISERRAIGELNHPDRPFADPKQAAIMVESLSWRGNLVIGKARVLNTPDGNIIKALLEADFKGGVSSRGLGDIKERNGVKEVTNFMLGAIDFVDMPSGQACYVNPLMESASWIQNNGIWVPEHEIQKKQDTFLENFREFLDSIKKVK